MHEEEREMPWIFLESLLLWDSRVCAMQVNSKDKHDFRGSDDLSCRANCSDDIVALFLLMQNHEERT